MANIPPTIWRFNPKIPRWKCKKLFFLEKWCNSNPKAIICAAIVAKAAPRIPQPKPKINKASNPQFTITAVNVAAIAFCG